MFTLLGPIARAPIGMQVQYAARYVDGSHGFSNLGHGLRFQGDVGEYHGLMIHQDHVAEFVRRIRDYRDGR